MPALHIRDRIASREFVVRIVQLSKSMARARCLGQLHMHHFKGSRGFDPRILRRQRGVVFMLEYSARTDEGAEAYRDFRSDGSSSATSTAARCASLGGTVWALSKFEECETPDGVDAKQSFKLVQTWMFPVPVSVVPTSTRGRWVGLGPDDGTFEELSEQVRQCTEGKLELGCDEIASAPVGDLDSQEIESKFQHLLNIDPVPAVREFYQAASHHEVLEMTKGELRNSHPTDMLAIHAGEVSNVLPDGFVHVYVLAKQDRIYQVRLSTSHYSLMRRALTDHRFVGTPPSVPFDTAPIRPTPRRLGVHRK